MTYKIQKRKHTEDADSDIFTEYVEKDSEKKSNSQIVEA